MDARELIWGDDLETIDAALSAVDPDLHSFIRDFAYGEVMSRPGLDLKTRELLSIAFLTALGGPAEMVTHLKGALRVGASTTEVRETILQAALFVGFPRALAAMKAFAAVQRSAENGTLPE